MSANNLPRCARMLRLAGVALAAAALALAATSATASGKLPGEEPVSLEFVTSIVGPPERAPISGQALENITQEVSAYLRCPVCQGSTVSDSPSQSARNMKGEVRDLLAAGFSPEQVVSYFEFSYGEFVRLEPKAEGFNLVVWIAPLVLLLGGVGLTVIAIRRLSAGPAGTGAPPSETAPEVDPELARYLDKVRDLAYGSDDGASGASARKES